MQKHIILFRIFFGSSLKRYQKQFFLRFDKNTIENVFYNLLYFFKHKLEISFNLSIYEYILFNLSSVKHCKSKINPIFLKSSIMLICWLFKTIGSVGNTIHDW